MKIFKYIKSALGFDTQKTPPQPSKTVVSYDKKEIRAPIPGSRQAELPPPVRLGSPTARTKRNTPS